VEIVSSLLAKVTKKASVFFFDASVQLYIEVQKLIRSLVLSLKHQTTGIQPTPMILRINVRVRKG
jgi:hypothetical protein